MNKDRDLQIRIILLQRKNNRILNEGEEQMEKWDECPPQPKEILKLLNKLTEDINKLKQEVYNNKELNDEKLNDLIYDLEELQQSMINMYDSVTELVDGKKRKTKKTKKTKCKTKKTKRKTKKTKRKTKKVK